MSENQCTSLPTRMMRQLEAQEFRIWKGPFNDRTGRGKKTCLVKAILEMPRPQIFHGQRKLESNYLVRAFIYLTFRNSDLLPSFLVSYSVTLLSGNTEVPAIKVNQVPLYFSFELSLFCRKL